MANTKKFSDHAKVAGNIPEIKVGAVNDYTEIEADGTVSYIGEASVWDDIQGSLAGARLHSGVGKVDFNYLENAVTFQSGGNVLQENDWVLMSVQMPHKMKTNSSFHPHIHFKQDNGTNKIFVLQYRIQDNTGTYASDWVTTQGDTNTNTAIIYPGTGIINNMLEFPPIDMTGYSLSSVVQFRLVRTDVEVGDVEVYTLDCHYQIDTDGSREEYIK